jgi:2-polyprenyl-3-methyl-5-hydroxy-6-metoxy-1,4-benzoquinol methylase
MIFKDWEHAIATQADQLEGIFVSEFGIKPENASETKVLDVGTGIGTQLLGLAQKGYRITGSDLSNSAIERCRLEVAKRGLNATELLGGIDMRTIEPSLLRDAPFRLVISGDNCVPSHV